MSNLSFKKFRKELNEQRTNQLELGDEYKKLSPLISIKKAKIIYKKF